MSAQLRQSKARDEEEASQAAVGQDDPSGRVYAKWPICGGGEIRCRLTAHRGEPVLEFRFGEYAARGRWTPGARGVFFRIDELQSLRRAIGVALKDIKLLGLAENGHRNDR